MNQMKSASTLVSIIGDEDTVTGFLLAGIGERNTKGQSNFLIVDESKQHRRSQSNLTRDQERGGRRDIHQTAQHPEHQCCAHQPACIDFRLNFWIDCWAVFEAFDQQLWGNHPYCARDSFQRASLWPQEGLYYPEGHETALWRCLSELIRVKLDGKSQEFGLKFLLLGFLDRFLAGLCIRRWLNGSL